MNELAARLTIDFGKGFDESNLRYMRLFYRCFPKRDTLRHELTWSHYRRQATIKREKFMAIQKGQNVTKDVPSDVTKDVTKDVM